MGKRQTKNNKVHTSRTPSLPKGLPQRITKKTTATAKSQLLKKQSKHHQNNNITASTNPFERNKKKYRKESSTVIQTNLLQQQQQDRNKVNTFKDKRIKIQLGNNNDNDLEVVRRIVKERMKNNKKRSKFNLNDDDEVLTHKGRKIDDMTSHMDDNPDDEDSDEEYNEKIAQKRNTELHFGNFPGMGGITDPKLHRKILLEERIQNQKQAKENKKLKIEKQVDTFESMDVEFGDLASLLQFRSNDNSKSKDNEIMKKQKEEDDDWDKQQKGFQFVTKKVKALDRTKTPEEIAKEKADKLDKLEVKRLKRMNGEFDDDDDLSDVSSIVDHNNPEELSDEEDSEDEEEEEPMKVEDKGCTKDLEVGSKVMAKYHAKEQELYPQEEVWQPATITQINTPYYNVLYDDGDTEDQIHSKYIQTQETSDAITPTNLEEEVPKQEKEKLSKKKKLAMEIARKSVPYTFPTIPTTLESFHELISTYAQSGKDVNTILQRIYTSNSIKLHPENRERLHNLYDVLLRRFILVGDAVYTQEGEDDNVRWEQLDCLTQILYDMSQDSPHQAMSIWCRRIDVLSNTFTKKCHDISITTTDEYISAWPSLGVILLLRSLSHIFPTTDFRHVVVTPTVLLLGQYMSHAPVRSWEDLHHGILVGGLMLQYCKDTCRIMPELYSFLSSLVWLYYSRDEEKEHLFKPIPSMKAAASFLQLPSTSTSTDMIIADEKRMVLSLEKYTSKNNLPKAILTSALILIQSCIENQENNKVAHQANNELFADLYKSLVLFSNSTTTTNDVNASIIDSKLLLETINKVSEIRNDSMVRFPLQRSATAKAKNDSSVMIPKQLTPRLETKKSTKKIVEQQTKREYKENLKSTQRQMRKDAIQIETLRRSTTHNQNESEKEKRHKNYAWLEEDQATINQQVRLQAAGSGSGIMKGGGIGGVRNQMKKGGVRKKKQRT